MDINDIKQWPEYKRVREEFEIVERNARTENAYPACIDSAMLNVDALLEPFLKLLGAAIEENERSKLTSLPLKIRFAESRGLKVAFNGPATVNTVEAWMSQTRKNFERAVQDIQLHGKA